MVAGRSGPWLTVRAPAVYGPGDRETLAYFKAVARGLAPRPKVADARLSLIHVADLAEALALALDQPPPPSTYEIDDGREGGYSYRDMADAAGRALGRRPLSLAVPRSVMAAIARVNAIGHSLGGSVQILTPGKVERNFSQRLDGPRSAARRGAGLPSALRPGNRLRARRSCGTAGRDGSRACEIRRNKLSFHKESPFLALMRCLTPRPLEPLLRTAHELTVENDGIADTLTLTRGVSRAEVIREICVHLEPYQTGEKPITGETVIAKDLTIDSLAIMDMVMELEDRFDVSIPMSVIAEIHTVDQLADTIRDLSATPRKGA